MKYRIKVKKHFFHVDYAQFQVQAKYKYLPFWINVSSRFNKSEQAEDYITRMIKEIS